MGVLNKSKEINPVQENNDISILWNKMQPFTFLDLPSQVYCPSIQERDVRGQNVWTLELECNRALCWQMVFGINVCILKYEKTNVS